MRSISLGALQHYGRGAVRGRRQSEVLRGNAYPNVAAAGNVDVRGCLTGRIGRVPLVRTGRVCWLHASSDGTVFRGFRLAYGQSHTVPKALSCPMPIPQAPLLPIGAWPQRELTLPSEGLLKGRRICPAPHVKRRAYAKRSLGFPFRV